MPLAFLHVSAPPRDTHLSADPAKSLLRYTWIMVALAGLPLAWNAGELPRREPAAGATAASQSVAPDLALYLEVIARVRRGENYYAVAGEAIPTYGFPTASPLNWRLP